MKVWRILDNRFSRADVGTLESLRRTGYITIDSPKARRVASSFLKLGQLFVQLL